MNSFATFVPSKKFYINSKWKILAIIWITGITPIFVERNILGKEHVSGYSILFFGLAFICLFITSACFLIGGFNKNKQLNGSFNGDIVFNVSEILISGKEYPLKDLRKISFIRFDDYSGRKDDSKYILDRVSNGVDNIVTITLKTGEMLTYNFQQGERYQIRNIREQLINYHHEGKLHFLNLIDILGIEDYNAIQNFKQTLPGEVKY